MRDSSEPARPPRRGVRAPAALRRVAVVVLALVCAKIVIDLVGSVDWQGVLHAVTHLSVVQLVTLAGAVVVRQVLNAYPLTLFIERLSLFRATLSDQAATLMSTIAPPPSDMVLRLSIFRSWGIEPTRGLAGATTNVLAFYINRFVAPVLGFLLLLTIRFEPTYAVVAGVSAVVATTMLLLVLAVVRRASLAENLGRLAGRVVARLRRSVRPEAWAAAFLDFRTHVSSRLGTGLPRALAVLLVMVVVDGLILLLAIRFVGVGGGTLATIEVLGTFLVMFPLTLFPLAGIGVLDAALVAALTAVAGVQHESSIVAGLIVYRVFTLGEPMLLGAVALAVWRRTVPSVDREPRDVASDL